MAGLSFVVAESAMADLEALKAWYAEQGAGGTGERFVAEIFVKIAALQDHPEMGRVVPEFGQPYLRELIHPPFRIVYRQQTRRVSIIRVWRSERLLKMPPDESRRP